MDMYINSGGKKLKCGYTTGSCATAAAKAATLMLYSKTAIDVITIDTPKGIVLNLQVVDVTFGDGYVQCAVVKDGGDDIDVTHGLKIFARAEELDKLKTKNTDEQNENFAYAVCKENFVLKGGNGVGKVMGEGLYVKKGEAAINPIPRLMIEKEVTKVLPEEKGVEITIFVPTGDEIAKKTFNPRLNIVGGISILGTSGIVYPMSEDAIKESIDLEIKQKAINHKTLILVFGNMGERVAKDYGYGEEQVVVISNYVGFALESCQSNGVKKVIIIGHIGKVGKVASGCFNTHSRVCDVRLETLALELALHGAPRYIFEKVYKEKTTEGAIKVLGGQFNYIYPSICKKIKERMEIYTYHSIECEVIMYWGATKPEILGVSEGVAGN